MDFEPDFTCCMDASVPTCRYLNRPYAGADKDTFQYYMIDGFIVSDNITVNSSLQPSRRREAYYRNHSCS